MKTEINVSHHISGLIDVEAVMRQARDDRAKSMRSALASAPALLKCIAATLRPNRQRLPQTGAWAGHRA